MKNTKKVEQVENVDMPVKNKKIKLETIKMEQVLEVNPGEVNPREVNTGKEVDGGVDEGVDEGSGGSKKKGVLFDFKALEDKLDKMMGYKEEEKVKIKNDILELKCIKKEVKKMYDHIVNGKRKYNGSSSGTRVPSGFASKEGTFMSPELCEFLGVQVGTKIARISVVSRIRDYIKDRQLEDPSDRRCILLDAKLEKLLGNSETRRETIRQRKMRKPDIKGDVTDKVHYFNLQIHLRRHFLDVKDEQVVLNNVSSRD